MAKVSGEYTTSLVERRGLIEHTDRILLAYDKTLNKKELAKKVCEKGYLAEMNWSTCSEVVMRFFAKRYMNEDFIYTPAEFFISGESEGASHKIIDKNLMYFVFTALVELPLFDFVSKYFYISSQHIDVIDKYDVDYFLKHEMANRQLDFTDKKIARMSSGIMMTLKEFGLLTPIEKSSHKPMRINRPYLSDQLMLQLIYFFKKNAFSDYHVVHNRVWYLFGLNGLDIIKRLNKRPDAYIVQSAGSVVQLSRPIQDDNEFLNMLSVN